MIYEKDINNKIAQIKNFDNIYKQIREIDMIAADIISSVCTLDEYWNDECKNVLAYLIAVYITESLESNIVFSIWILQMLNNKCSDKSQMKYNFKYGLKKNDYSVSNIFKDYIVEKYNSVCDYHNSIILLNAILNR